MRLSLAFISRSSLHSRLAPLTIAAAVGIGSACANDNNAAAADPTQQSSTLNGKLYGPVGTEVTLEDQLGNPLDLSVAPFPSSTDDYNLTPFAWPVAFADGTAYTLTVTASDSRQSCILYRGASGTAPVAEDLVRVGCEWTYDLVSRGTDDAVRGTYYESSTPAVGGSAGPVGSTVVGYGEGRFVVFVSSAAGLAGTSGAHRQIFWRDRLTGETRLVSANADGEEGNADSFAPVISADGLVVAFESYANNLVSGDTNGVRDIFVWDPQAIALTAVRVSVGPDGAEANAESLEPSLSGDGQIIAFTSGASNLTSGVSGTNTLNVIRRDLVAGVNTLISANPVGVGVGGSHPVLSEDGSRLAFYSFAATLVSGDANGLWDIFVYDDDDASLSRVSLTSTGAERNQGNESTSRVVAPAISGDGRYVAFATTATNMVPGDTNDAQDVFVVDTADGSVVRASVSSSGIEGNADSPVGQGERVSLSYDGAWVGFTTLAQNFGTGAGNAAMHAQQSGETRVITEQSGSSVGPVVLSHDAAYAALGVGSPLDARFDSSGLFVRFTNAGRAWWWLD